MALRGGGDVVEEGSAAFRAVPVHHDPQQPTLARRDDLHGLQLQSERGQDGRQQGGDLAVPHVLASIQLGAAVVSRSCAADCPRPRVGILPRRAAALVEVRSARGSAAPSGRLVTSGLDRRRFLGLGLGLGRAAAWRAPVAVSPIPGSWFPDAPPTPGATRTLLPAISRARRRRRPSRARRRAPRPSSGWPGSAAALLTGPWRRSLGARKALLVGVEAAHLEHATALLGDATHQPPDRPTGRADQADRRRRRRSRRHSCG